MVGEAISQKVYKAVGLAVELVDSFWELVGNNRGKEIATNDDRAGTAVELPCLDSLGGIVGEALSQKNGEAVAISLRELVSENRGDEITTNDDDQAETLDGHSCDGSVGGTVGEAMSQKVDETVGLAVGLVDSFLGPCMLQSRQGNHHKR